MKKMIYISDTALLKSGSIASHQTLKMLKHNWYQPTCMELICISLILKQEILSPVYNFLLT